MSRAIPIERVPYPDTEQAGTWRIPLTQGREALIDATDVDRVRVCCWYYEARDGSAAARTPGGRKQLHHFIAGPRRPGLNLDFVNGDRLDCRCSNLTYKTRSEQVQRYGKRCTRGKGTPPTSKYRGVWWAEQNGQWRAGIQIAGRRIDLGLYSDERIAASRYDEAAREHFGPRALINFPDRHESSN